LIFDLSFVNNTLKRTQKMVVDTKVKFRNVEDESLLEQVNVICDFLIVK
jgi:hypothetical protein